MINLTLLDVPAMMGVLKGVAMEIEDCAYPLSNSLTITDQTSNAFIDCDVAILVGAFPRRENMERKDLLRHNAAIFKCQGEALNQKARPSVRVLVVGNPANTNAYICSHYARDIPKENFAALTRLDENRTTAMLAAHLRLNPSLIKNSIIWGNHSSTQFPDISHIKLDGKTLDGRTLVTSEWHKDFIKRIQTRGAAVIAARKLSSATSAAKAIADSLNSWLNGTPLGECTSMAVFSNGQYSIPKGLFYSFPVTCHNATWRIVEDLEIDDFGRCMMDETAAELISEREEAIEFLGLDRKQ